MNENHIHRNSYCKRNGYTPINSYDLHRLQPIRYETSENVDKEEEKEDDIHDLFEFDSLQSSDDEDDIIFDSPSLFHHTSIISLSSSDSVAITPTFVNPFTLNHNEKTTPNQRNRLRDIRIQSTNNAANGDNNNNNNDDDDGDDRRERAGPTRFTYMLGLSMFLTILEDMLIGDTVQSRYALRRIWASETIEGEDMVGEELINRRDIAIHQLEETLDNLSQDDISQSHFAIDSNENSDSKYKALSNNMPKNISDHYSGDWMMFSNETIKASSDSLVPYQDQPIVSNIDVISSASKDDLASHELPFSQAAGMFRLNLQSIPTSIKNIHYVNGVVEFWNGATRTGRDEKSLVSGFYFQSIGKLKLFTDNMEHVAIKFTVVDDASNNNNVHNNPAGIGHEISTKTLWDRHLVSLEELLHNSHKLLAYAHSDCTFQYDFDVTLKDQTSGDELKPKNSDLEIIVDEEDKDLGDGIETTVEIIFPNPSSLSLDPSSNSSASANNPFVPEPRVFEPVQLNGIADSESCNMILQIKADTSQLDIQLLTSKAGTYSLISAFIPLIQMSFLLFQIVQPGTQAQTANISLLTIGMMAVLDAYSTLIYFTSGIVLDSISSGFAIVAILKLILFAVIELRYLFLIFRSRYPQTLEANMRQQIGLLYTRFYFFLIGCIFISYQFHEYHRSLVFLASSFWIPQILVNIERNCRKPYHMSFLVGMSITRLFEPLYYYGCPKSFIPLISEDKTSQFSPNTAIGLLMWVGFQVLILRLQRMYGARFFVPKFLLPKEYDYYRTIPITIASQDDLDCVICMEPVNAQKSHVASSDNNINTNNPASSMERGEISTSNNKQHVITPCNHVFHEECLQRWCVQKMECPTCRTTLPQNTRLLADNNADDDAPPTPPTTAAASV